MRMPSASYRLPATRLAGILALASTLVVPGLVANASAQSDPCDYVGDLNAPILEISEENKSYPIYFAAIKELDVADDRIPQVTTHLQPGTGIFADATSWAGEAAQQTAIEILLATDDDGLTAMDREVFGLPYDIDHIEDEEMIDYDFVCYIDNCQIRDVEFAYLPYYETLMSLLKAEANRRAEAGDSEGATEAIVAMANMARQLCDRHYGREMRLGMDLLVEACQSTRELMWHYRDTLEHPDLRNIARAFDRMDLERIKLPRAEMILGQQIVERIFVLENYSPDVDEFSTVMAKLESGDHPLQRFQAAAKWRQLGRAHAPYTQTREEFRKTYEDFDRIWSLPLHDPLLSSSRRRYDTLDPVEYAMVRFTLEDLAPIFDLRLWVYCQVHGTATTAGILAFHHREAQGRDPQEARLIEGKPASFAPIRLAQIQPAFVPSEDAMIDPYRAAGEQFFYTVIRKTDPTLARYSFPVFHGSRRVMVPEGWPFVYSIGPDGLDSRGARHTTEFDGEGDVIFFPPIELMK